MIHCSVDIETFATCNNPAIVSIGACMFDPDGLKGKILDDPFYCAIGWRDATKYGEVSTHTLMWWLTQDKKAIDALSIDGEPLLAALMKLTAWYSFKIKPKAIWSHTFDTVALHSAYATQNLKTPWHYREERDLRTLVELWKRSQPMVKVMGKPGNTDKHHALADAIYQAKYIQGMLQDMNYLGLQDGETEEIVEVDAEGIPLDDKRKPIRVGIPLNEGETT